MMVLVIFLAIAGSFVTLTFTSTTSNRAMQETISKMDKLQAAITKYENDNGGTKPATLGDLISNLSAPSIAACAASYGSSKAIGWCGPYLDVTLSNDLTNYSRDGWGSTFSWNGAGTLYSFGPNKIDNAGGGDDIQRTGL